MADAPVAVRVDDVAKILYSEGQVQKRMKEIGNLIRMLPIKTPEKHPFVMICVLSQAVVFFTDLMRELSEFSIIADYVDYECHIDAASGTEEVVFTRKIGVGLAGANVLLVDYSQNSGRKLQGLKNYILKHCTATNVWTVVLLAKLSREFDPAQVEPDVIGFDVAGGVRVVGYGGSSLGRYGNLKHIAYLQDKEIIVK
jgi:hypoxanthine phosphoribosyltransferase